MPTIKSTLKLSNINKEEVHRFIEHWRSNTDLPCEKINFKNIDHQTILIEIDYPLEIFDKTVSQFISIIYAEIPLVKAFGKVNFIDLELPEQVYKWFNGPKFGVEGIKRRFKLSKFPFLLAITKPSLNTTIPQLKNKIEEVLSTGFHAIKDDEMLGNVSHSRLEERIKLAKEYKKYIPVLNLDRLEEYKLILSDGEISMILINASTLGFPLLNEIKKVSEVPLCSHMALQGTFAANFSAKVFAKLHRLFGCDAYVLPIGNSNYYSLTKEEEEKMIEEFVRKLPIKKTLPILVGGANRHNIKELVRPYKKGNIPLGIAFGSFIFSGGKSSKDQCDLITAEIGELRSE